MLSYSLSLYHCIEKWQNEHDGENVPKKKFKRKNSEGEKCLKKTAQKKQKHKKTLKKKCGKVPPKKTDLKGKKCNVKVREKSLFFVVVVFFWGGGSKGEKSVELTTESQKGECDYQCKV